MEETELVRGRRDGMDDEVGRVGEEGREAVRGGVEVDVRRDRGRSRAVAASLLSGSCSSSCGRKHLRQSLPNAAPVKSTLVENTPLNMSTPRALQRVSRTSCGTHKSKSPSLPHIQPSSDSSHAAFGSEQASVMSASHIRMVLSKDPEAMCFPFGENATEVTAPV